MTSARPSDVRIIPVGLLISATGHPLTAKVTIAVAATLIEYVSSVGA